MNVTNALLNHCCRLGKKADLLIALTAVDNPIDAKTMKTEIIKSAERIMLRNEVLIFDLEYDKFESNSSSLDVKKRDLTMELKKLNQQIQKQLDDYRMFAQQSYIDKLVHAIQHSKNRIERLHKQSMC